MASTFLSRTQGTATSRKIFTISVWVKRANLSAQQQIFETWLDNNNRFDVQFTASDKLLVQHTLSGSTSINIETSRLFRDTSAWYHILVKVDTTQATASDRVEIYINGSQETSLSPETYPSQNLDLALGTSSYTNFLGKYSSSGGNYFDGSMAHVHFTDGTAYNPSTFGETDSTTGIWKPKTSPSVTYGTNGFFLDFADSSAMGDDESGNTNDYTVSGTMTQTIDTPSNVFATLNPLCTGSLITLSNGNLKATGNNASNSSTTTATLGFSKGKYYWEAKIVNVVSGYPYLGIYEDFDSLVQGNLQGGATSDREMTVYIAGGNTTLVKPGTDLTITAPANNDIIMFAVDKDNNKFYMGVNGTWYNSGDPTSGATGTGSLADLDANGVVMFGSHNYNNSATELNFGNGYFGTTAVASAGTNSGIGTFEYDVPSGYKALCTKNINAQEYS